MAKMGPVLEWGPGEGDALGSGFGDQWSALWDWPFKPWTYAGHSTEPQLLEGCLQSDCRNARISMISTRVIHARRRQTSYLGAAPNIQLESSLMKLESLFH